MIAGIPACGLWNTTRITATANTKIVQVIPPFLGNSGGGSMVYAVTNPSTAIAAASQTSALPNWQGPTSAFTHITDMIYTALSTVHSLYIMRPLNWAYQLTDMTSSSTTMSLSADPGAWATAGNYKYGNGVVPSQAANAIAANDYVAFQLNDGRWIADTVASGTVSAPVLTTGIPAVTGTKLLAGSPLFFFGLVTDTDPGTGNVHVLNTADVANTRNVYISYGAALWNSLHRGDPLIFISSNGTDAGILEVLSGFYSSQG